MELDTFPPHLQFSTYRKEEINSERNMA